MPNDLDQKKLEAEIANLQSQTAKIDAEKYNLRRSWRDWIVEAIKVVGAIILAGGGIFAAITGYQLAEIQKEKTELAIMKNNDELAKLEKQKVQTLQQLGDIKTEIDTFQASLEAARNAKSDNATFLDAAISRTANIGSAVASTNAQLLSGTPSHQLSDFLVGLQTLGVDDATRKQLNQKIRDRGYSLHENSESYQKNQRPSWFAPKSTVFYYSQSAMAAANQLAGVMKELTGGDFIVQRGAGSGLNPAQRDVTLFVDYVKN